MCEYELGRIRVLHAKGRLKASLINQRTTKDCQIETPLLSGTCLIAEMKPSVAQRSHCIGRRPAAMKFLFCMCEQQCQWSVLFLNNSMLSCSWYAPVYSPRTLLRCISLVPANDELSVNKCSRPIKVYIKSNFQQHNAFFLVSVFRFLNSGKYFDTSNTYQTANNSPDIDRQHDYQNRHRA